MHLFNSFLPKLFLVIAASAWLVACGSGSDEPTTDTTPDAFHFDDQSEITPNTVITSNRITVSGIEAAVAISVTDGEYAIDDSAFTSAAGSVSNGQTVTLRHTSSSLYTSATTTYLNIGGVRGSFTSTTLSSDTSPDAFNFVDQTDVSPNTLITSNPITISGIDGAAAISVTDGEYAIDDNPFTSAAGTVSNGQTIRLRHTSSTSFMTMKSTFISIGGISGSFVSTTGPIGTGFNKALGFNDSVTSITPAADGSGDLYLIGDFTTYDNTASKHIIRLNSDGSVDTAFALGSGFDGAIKSVSTATDGSGDLYVGGIFTSYNGIASNHIIRLNSDGTVDTAFAVGTGFAGVYSSTGVYAITPAMDGSGDLYVGGNFSTYNGIASNNIIRLNSDGTVDDTFAVGSGFAGVYSSTGVYSISPATDTSGDLYVGGDFSSYNGIASNNIIRLNSNGTVDNGFSVGSGFDVSDDSSFGLPVISHVNTIAPTTDGSGDLYVGGSFDIYNGIASKNIIRLNSDGTVDNSFALGAGVDRVVLSINPISDGSGDLYLGGGFTTYNG
ncbi:MAG: delta-60 repeat domain-containing protein, partial [Candidatus Thiodiazotropha sp.]